MRLSISRTAEGTDTVVVEKVVPWPNPSVEPSSDTIAATIRDVAGEACDEASVRLHADDMASALATMLSSARAGTPPPAVPTAVWQPRSARSWIMPRASVMLTVSWVAPPVILAIGLAAVHLRFSRWRRPVRNDEVPAVTA